jgi:hypothetical protein
MTSSGLAIGVDRCGICDATTVVTRCDACQEPVCMKHLRATGEVATRGWICAACAIEAANAPRAEGQA